MSKPDPKPDPNPAPPRTQRVADLVKKIQEYDPDFQAKDLEDALTLASQKSRSLKRLEQRYESWKSKEKEWNDHFPDPLDVVEKLVELEKADRDTILASVLYPLVRSIGNNGFNYNRLDDITTRFGKRTRWIILDTLGLWALDQLHPGTQKADENFRDYTLMALLAAKSRSAILIRSVTSQVKLSAFEGKDLTWDRGQKDFLINQANIMARLSYIADFPKLYNVILNTAFRIRDPEKYDYYNYFVTTAPPIMQEGQDTKIQSAARAKLTESDIAAIKKKISAVVNEKCGLTNEDYTLEWRHKEPHSLEEKVIRKNRPPEEMDDVQGLRLVMKVPEGPYDRDTWAAKCRAVYEALSHEFGERSEKLAPYYQQYVHKREDKQDYYGDIKESGYQAIQGNLGFRVGNKFITAEMQVVDEKAHQNNQNGAASHYYLKTGLSSYQDIVLTWKQANVAAVLTGMDVNPATAVAFYDINQDIVVVRSSSEGRCTVGHYLSQNRKKIRRHGGNGAAQGTPASRITGVYLDNSNVSVRRDPTRPVSLQDYLVTGDRIVKYRYA